jgi:surface antigen
MSITPRLASPVYPDKPYAWGVATQGQCTWYAYWRVQEMGFSAPCYWSRASRSGAYTNAKYWLKNYREPWEVKDASYTPTVGDIVVFDGSCGHVAVVETIEPYTLSNYNKIKNGKYTLEFWIQENWTPGSALSGSGKVLGYLHYPTSPITPVEKNSNVNQVETTDSTLRVRSAPSLNASVLGFVSIGYYNILDQEEADNYTWYEVETGKWIANITTIYHEGQNPKEDILQKLNDIETLTKEIKNLIGG